MGLSKQLGFQPYNFIFQTLRLEYVHAEVAENGRRVAGERMTDEWVGEAGQHAREEYAEARLLLPCHLAVWSQQVLHGQNSDDNRSYRQSWRFSSYFIKLWWYMYDMYEP